jgi:hypothetical protein
VLRQLVLSNPAKISYKYFKDQIRVDEFDVRFTVHFRSFNENNIPTNAQIPVYLASICLRVSALYVYYGVTIPSEYEYLQFVKMHNTNHDVIMCGCVFKICVYNVEC